MNKKKIWKSWLFYVIVIILIGIAYWFFTPSEPGEYDDFAKCLSEKGIKMYGTNWCHFCKEQKEIFGNSFKQVDYVNCEYRSGKCLEAEVKGYPTWKIDDVNYQGVQQIEDLAELSGCGLD